MDNIGWWSDGVALRLEMPDIRWHARNTQRRARAARALAMHSAARNRWRRERFWRQASRYASVVGTIDRFGNRVLLNTADPWVSRETFVGGVFDSGNMDNLVVTLAERDLTPHQILDIGANIGTSTLELMSVFPAATAIAVEPHPDNYRLLCQNVIANGLEHRVRTVNAAVGDVDGMVPLSVNQANPGDHQVSGTGDHTIDVRIRRLGDLVTVDRPTLLWIDVQGYEGHVFRGAGDALGCPALVEFWPRRLKATGGYVDFLEAVSSYGSVFQAQNQLQDAGDLAELGQALTQSGGYTDLLLLP